MITLVACGHTVGGVRSTDFPDLVPPGFNPDIPVIATFDPTAQFDHAVIQHYLDGSTTNPLVVHPNKTMTSDLKIFSSDGNATVSGLATAEGFANSCRSIFTRMINTVPSSVQLTDPIELLPAKVSGVQLTIERDTLVFKAALRLTQPLNSTTTGSRVVTMYWCDRYGDAKDCSGSKHFALPANKLDEQNISPVTQALGFSFTTYNFVVPIDRSASISKFWFSIDAKDGSQVVTEDNGGAGYVLEQDQVLFVPTSSRSVLNQAPLGRRGGETGAGNFTRLYDLVAAVRNGPSSPSRVYADTYESAINGFPQPFTSTIEFQLNSSASSTVQGSYSLYSASIEDSGYYLTFDLHAIIDGTTYTEDFRQTTFLDNTPYVAPVSVESTSGAVTVNVSWMNLMMMIGILLSGWL